MKKRKTGYKKNQIQDFPKGNIKIILSEEHKPMFDLMRYLDRYPKTKDGEIIGLDSRKACESMNMIQPCFCELLRSFRDDGHLTYTCVDGVYDIRMNYFYKKK